MATVVRIGQGRSKSGKILDASTKWFSVNTTEQWERCIHEWSLKENSGKPIYISRNGRAYVEISGLQLLAMREMYDK